MSPSLYIMDKYLVILTVVGLATFFMAWMPRIAKRSGISYSIYYLVAGYLLYLLFPDLLPDPLPQHNGKLTLHLTELIVIISLMGAGIKIDRSFSLRSWSMPLKLIGITMMLCIGATVLLGYYFLGLGLASATLLGAALAPTDPVLASDVQVGPPNEKARSATKFTLTSEAGLNDGVAFPFTWLAVAIGLMSTGADTSIAEWFAFDFVYRILAGICIGIVAGKAVGYLVFDLAEKSKVLSNQDGLLAISVTLLVYGVTEMVSGYGFIAVFICAITMRHYEKHHKYHQKLHAFTDQIERLLVCLLLILFGGAIAMGVLSPLTWQMIVFAFVFVLVLRPLLGLIGLWTSKISGKEKLGIAFFGIRGMGSIFYLSFAFSKFGFENQQELWAVVLLTILISIVIHGLTATAAMKILSTSAANDEEDSERTD